MQGFEFGQELVAFFGGDFPAGSDSGMTRPCCRAIADNKRFCNRFQRLMNELRPMPLFPSAGPDPLPLQAGVFVRTQPDERGECFVRLRALADAVVYSGCILDAGGQALQPLEIWVQTAAGVAGTLAARRWKLDNALLDARWRERHQLFLELDPARCLTSGFEILHPLPLGFNLAQGAMSYLKDQESGQEWQLCQDDALLTTQGLPAYSGSLERYLYLPGQTPPRFAPAALPAAAAPAASPAEIAGADWIPFNPEGGLMLFLCPAGLGLEEYLDSLSGRPVRINFPETSAPAPPPAHLLADARGESASSLFLTPSVARGRLAEVFYLKLSLLAGMLDLVRAAARRQAMPFLNLAGDSFGVQIAPTATGLPGAWNARLHLLKPGQALAARLGAGGARFFARLVEAAAGDYFPQGIDQCLEGAGAFRVLEAKAQADGRWVVRGTLATRENLQGCSGNDVLTLSLASNIGRFNLQGSLEPGEGLPPRHYRFRTHPLDLPPAAQTLLSDPAGFNFPAATFEIVPALSTPCDLYALGMLAVRVLLASEPQKVAAACEALHQLAELLPPPAAAQSAPATVAFLLKASLERQPTAPPQCLRLLGPQHLYDAQIDAAAALQFVPLNLWSDTLHWLLRLFPGLLPDSYARNYGDAPAEAVEVVFDRPIEDLMKLRLRAKSLVLIDWSLNREINEVIGSLLAEQKLSPASRLAP